MEIEGISIRPFCKVVQSIVVNYFSRHLNPELSVLGLTTNEQMNEMHYGNIGIYRYGIKISLPNIGDSVISTSGMLAVVEFFPTKDLDKSCNYVKSVHLFLDVTAISSALGIETVQQDLKL